ncbi:O-antigen ligase family protein [Candidatus Binatia bacterium]|nr:O-antigen ligase family protein [Candidatus Binatia bacterium]
MNPRRLLDVVALWGTASLVVVAVLLLASVSYTGRYAIQFGAALIGVVWCARRLFRSRLSGRGRSKEGADDVTANPDDGPGRERGGEVSALSTSGSVRHALSRWVERLTSPESAGSTAALAFAALIALLVFPLLPLPPMLIGLLSPSGFEATRTALPGWPEQAPLGDVAAAVEMTSPLPGAGAWRPLSLVPWDTLSALSIGAAYLLIGCVVAFYPWRDAIGTLRRLIGLLIGLALMLAIYGYLQASSGYGRILWFECYRPVCMGTYPNKDHFAGFLEMIFPLALAWAIGWWEQARRDPVVRARRRGLVWHVSDYSRLLSHPTVARAAIAGTVAFLLFVALAVSGSRSAFLATFATLAIMVPLLPPGAREERSAPERWRDRWFGAWGEKANRLRRSRRRRSGGGNASRHASVKAAPPAPGADVWSAPAEDIVYEYPLRNGFGASVEPQRTIAASPASANEGPETESAEAEGPVLESELAEDLRIAPPVPEPEATGRLRSHVALLPAVLAFLAIFYLTFPQIFPRLWEGELARHWLTLDTLNLAVQYPLFGTGLGTFAAVFPLYKPYTFAAYEFGIPAAHNDYAQFLAETGIPAALTAAALFGLFGVRVFRVLRGATSRTPDALLRWGLAAGVLAMLVHSFTDFNLHRAANALVFAVLVGGLVRITREKKSRGHSPRSSVTSASPVALRLLVPVAAGVCCAFWASWTWTNWSAAAAYHAVYPDTWLTNLAETPPVLPDAERIDLVRRAVELAPAAPEYQAGLAEQLRAVAVDEEVGPAFGTPAFDEAMQASFRALWAKPLQPEVLLGLVQVADPVYEPDPGTEPGVLYDLVGRATALAPYDPRLQLAAARWYVDKWEQLPEQVRPDAAVRIEKALVAAAQSPELQKDVGVAQSAFQRRRENG